MDFDAVLKSQADCVIGEEDGEMYYDSRPAIAFLALFAFAEGFFKSTFAAIGNMCPTALLNFSKSRPDTRLSLDDLLCGAVPIDSNLGSLVAETLDFGTAKKINGIFEALLRVTPFRAKDAGHFERLMAKRNQIAHHGGMITARYFRQNSKYGLSQEDIYHDSIVITPNDTISAKKFILAVAEKLTEQGYATMVELEGEKVLRCEDSGEEYLLFKYFRGDCRAMRDGS